MLIEILILVLLNDLIPLNYAVKSQVQRSLFCYVKLSSKDNGTVKMFSPCLAPFCLHHHHHHHHYHHRLHYAGKSRLLQHTNHLQK